MAENSINMMVMEQDSILRDGIDSQEIFRISLLKNMGFFHASRGMVTTNQRTKLFQTKRSSDLGKSLSPLLEDWVAHRASSQQPGSLQEAWLWLQRLECVIP